MQISFAIYSHDHSAICLFFGLGMIALCRLSRALVPGGRTLRLACAPALKPMLTVGVGFTTFNAITSRRRSA